MERDRTREEFDPEHRDEPRGQSIGRHEPWNRGGQEKRQDEDRDRRDEFEPRKKK